MACLPEIVCLQPFDVSGAVLDMCEGESPDIIHFDIPSILIEIDTALQRDAMKQEQQRRSAEGRTGSDEETESTAL